jgi:antitoxin VapB
MLTNTSEVIIRQEDGKLIIEPYKKKSLLETLSTLEPLDEEFPDVDHPI